MELQRLERTEKLQQEKIRKIENVSYQLQQELESDLLQYYEIEFTTLQKQYQDLQGEFKETAENLVRDKDFYKEQYELAQASESKIKKDLEEVQNILKLKTDELEDYKDRMQVNEKIITELNAKMKESNNIVKLKKKLKEERRLNEELIDTVQRLQKELRDVSARRSQEDTLDSDIEDMVQRELHLSVRLDKQLMQVIENDEVVDGIATEDQKTNEIRKDNELLKRLKDDLEIERDIMRHQIAEYEDRILQLKADLTEQTEKVVKLDKKLISERNAVDFLRTQMEEYRRKAEAKRRRESRFIVELLHEDFAATVQNESDRTSENLEESREHNAQLRETIKKLENKMSKYEKKLEIVMEEQERLISSLAVTNGLKENLEAHLRKTTEELRAREQDCNHLQKQLKILTENKKQDQRDAELDEIKELRREINIAREVRIKLEADLNCTKQELKKYSNLERSLSCTIQKYHCRYLREKRREISLISQKRYLLRIISTHVLCDESIVFFLSQLTRHQRLYLRKKMYKVRFKIIVFTIVSVHRMKKMTKRSRMEKILDAILLPVRPLASNHSRALVRKRATNASSEQH
ncbi:uncharacterized protein [Temnothorax nylanderi]|uniref:uncharacterized protein n=1 Tax=Temnothorax nylanderi TaxID=102681 RepID=UPI003A8A5101